MDDWLSRGTDKELQGEQVLSHKLTPHLMHLAHFRSTRALEKSIIYQGLQPDITAVTYGYEYGCPMDPSVPGTGPQARAVVWNLGGCLHYEGILDTLRNHPLLSRADFYFLPAVDIGMARSENRNVARSLALELGCYYYYANCYLNLPSLKAKENPNPLGLEGNAILSRYPLTNLRIVSLANSVDPMRGATKKIGCDKVLLADVKLGEKMLTLACVRLAGLSSQAQRAQQMASILKRFSDERIQHAILVAGDFKTSTYNCRAPLNFFFSVFNKYFRGADYIREEHHTFPEKHFARQLFDVLKSHGFHYEDLNELGTGTVNGEVQDIFTFAVLNRSWFRHLVKIMLGGEGKPLTLKYDWFAANDQINVSSLPQAEHPKVLQHLFHNGQSLSLHDPILLDFETVSKN